MARRSMVLLAVLALGAVASALPAFGETITLYYWGDEADLLALDQIRHYETLRDGSDGHPAIRVIMGQTASINRTNDPQRLLTAIVGGDPPDVVFFDRFAVGEWASRGAFLPLQPYYERDLQERPNDPYTLHEEDFFDACWKEAVYDGALYCVPRETDDRGLYYNKDSLARHAKALIAAGCVDPDDPTKPGPPTTWEQLAAATEIMTERDANGNLVRIGFLPYSPNFGNSWLYLYGWLNGGHFMSADRRTCTLNDPPIVEALAFMTRLYNIMGGAERTIAFQSSAMGGLADPFMTGQIAMKIDSDYYMKNIAQQKPDLRFGVTLAPAPKGKQRLGWSGGFSWVIPKGARHPDEAWEFIKYLASPEAYRIRAEEEAQTARAAGTYFIPQMSSRKEIARWAYQHYLVDDPAVPERYKAAYGVLLDGMAVSKSRPVTAVGQLLWNEQARAMEAGIYQRYDKTDPLKNAQEALDRGTKVVQEELDRIASPVPYPVLPWQAIVVTYALLLVAAVAGTMLFFQIRMRKRGIKRSEARAGYLFAAPWFIGFVVFSGGPMLFSLFMSFCRYDVLHPARFVGIENFVLLFTHDPLFYKALYNTAYMAIGVPLGMAVSLGMALLLKVEVRGVAIYRTVFYLPAIMPAVAASVLWIWLFNPDQGLINLGLAKMGIAGPAWLQSAAWAKPALILMGLWSAGGNMVVWLAGLKAIPGHLYEAAKLDGAGPVRRFWYITLPMLSPYILFNTVMGLIGTFQIFAQAYIMTQGGPLDATLFFAYALFNNAFRYMKMGYASAMAWVLFAIVLVLTVLQLRLSRRWVHYESEK